ncbi:MAG: radical SAM protein, partial [Acidobacteriota bacterium]
RRFKRSRPHIDGVKLTLIGGEPLLHPRRCREIIASVRQTTPQLRVDATTNLAVTLDREHLALVSELDELVVSLDGLEPLHNAQRRAYRDSFNPFVRTLTNVSALVDAGFSDKLYVQGAIRDEYAQIEHFQDFQRELMRIGVRYDRIAFETIHPSEHQPTPQQSYLACLRAPRLREQVCCKYRGGHHLVIGPNGALFSDFYDWDELGRLTDEVEALQQRFDQLVERMPALRDPTCRECPVIGYCWGGCSNASRLVGDRPSAFCDQHALTERIVQLARDGNLVSLPRSGRCR